MKTKTRIYCLFILLSLIFSIGVPGAAIAQSGESQIFLPILYNRFDTGFGDIKGNVIDAVSGSPVSGAKVCFEDNCTQTDENGSYNISGIPAGGQYFHASAATYYSIGRWADVIANQEKQVNLVMSQILSISQVTMRIITTWSTNQFWPPANYENDLDAFLWVTTSGIAPQLVWDATPNVSIAQCTSYPNACKENDAREGTGPETIAIQILTPGSTYYFGVLNYNQYQPDVPAISETEASIGVYSEQGLMETFSVPSKGDGNFWYVFSMDDSGVIHPQNCIIELSPSEATLPDCNLQPTGKMQKMPLKP
jgi:Carboxypeptidase regulatory-like domain